MPLSRAFNFGGTNSEMVHYRKLSITLLAYFIIASLFLISVIIMINSYFTNDLKNLRVDLLLCSAIAGFGLAFWRSSIADQEKATKQAEASQKQLENSVSTLTSVIDLMQEHNLDEAKSKFSRAAGMRLLEGVSSNDPDRHTIALEIARAAVFSANRSNTSQASEGEIEISDSIRETSDRTIVQGKDELFTAFSNFLLRRSDAQIDAEALENYKLTISSIELIGGKLQPEIRSLPLHFSDAKVVDFDLTDLEFSEFKCENTEFIRCSFAGSDFYSMEASGCTFKDCTFKSATFTKAFFKGCIFEDSADGSTAERGVKSDWFTRAELQDSNFEDAHLIGIEFMGADLQNSDFSGADCRDAIFRGATGTDANFDGALLGDADFRGGIGFSAERLLAQNSDDRDPILPKPKVASPEP